MTVALATRGKLSSGGRVLERIVRELYASISSEVNDPLEISVEMVEVSNVESSVYFDDIVSMVEVVDDVTSDVEDENI